MKWFYNMKIGTRMLLGFFIVIAFAAGIGIKAVTDINKINKLDTKLYERITVPLGDMVNLTNAYQNIRADLRDVILSKNVSALESEKNDIDANSSEFDKNINIIMETILTADGKKVSNQIKADKDTYMEIVNNIISLKEANKVPEALTVLTSNKSKSIVENLENNLKNLSDMKVSLGEQTSSANDKTAKNSIFITTILLITGIIIASILAFLLSNSISKPVRKIMKIADKIADGDLDVSVDIDTKDEIGILAASFRKMAYTLNSVISNIDAAAKQVSSGAKQVSDSSVNISEGATEQASSVEELTASIEEISSQIKVNAENASRANELAESAKENAVQGNDQMREMQKSMEEINLASNNISKIIKAIDEIAFQTNILALNAAVEAARAGSNGKGFAVVAEEVRNLAARSSKAAKETADLIEGSIKKVNEGTDIANKSAEALSHIMDDITSVASIISEIATASNEQAAGISQINQGIMQVSAVVQNNSATSEEGAAASEELSSQAELLQQQTSKFKLKDDHDYGERSETLDPDIFNIIESMKTSNKTNYVHQEKSKFSMEDHKSIKLSDDEFGKY